MPRGIDPRDSAYLQGRLWTPAVLKPLCWLDAQDLGTISAAAGVSEWRDKSGRGNNATQATQANRPIISDGGLNGRRCVQFVSNGSSATDDALRFPSGMLNSATGATFAFAMKGTMSSNGGLFGPSSTNNAGIEFISFSGFPGTALLRINASIKYSSGVFSDNGVPAITSAVFNSSETIASFNGSAFAPASGSSSLNFNGVYALGSYNSSGFNMACSVGEWVIVEEWLPRSEVFKLEGYLSHKWGITLSSAHPFANRPPLIGD